MNDSSLPLLVKLYLASNRVRRYAFTLAHACFNGAWLGLLSQKHLHAVNEFYYSGERYLRRLNEPDYRADQYNQQGLWWWESQMVQRFFPSAGRLLVLGAGGGREVIALQRMGYHADGFECHSGLVHYANELLERIDLTPSVFHSQRDAAPDTVPLPPGGKYDGVIVGWGAYTHIRGRRRRIALLRELIQLAAPGAPVLLSFFGHHRASRRLRITASIGRIVSALRRGDGVEVGDDLSVNFVRYFTEVDVRSEMLAAGYQLVHFSIQDYGHAVGVSNRASRDLASLIGVANVMAADAS